jgi:hypothetical protein
MMKFVFAMSGIAAALWTFVLVMTPDGEALGFVVFLSLMTVLSGILAFHPKYRYRIEERL